MRPWIPVVAALLSPLSALAGDRSAEVPVNANPTPVTGPSYGAGPAVGAPSLNAPGLGAGTIDVNTKVPEAYSNASERAARAAEGQAPGAGALAPGLDGKAGLESPSGARLEGQAQGPASRRAKGASLENGASPLGPEQGAGVVSPQAAGGGASALSGTTAGLDAAVGSIKKGDQAGGEVVAGENIKRLFDAARVSSVSLGAGAPAAGVAGRLQRVEEKVTQTTGIARSASAHDAPGLYRAALTAVEEAVTSRLLAASTGRAAAEAILAQAGSSARAALTELANGAYKAAASGPSGDKEVARAVGAEGGKAAAAGLGASSSAGSLDKWNELLSAPGRPLVSNLERLKSDIRRVQEEARRAAPGARTAAPQVWFDAEGGRLVARLPSSSVAALPAALAAELALPELSAPAGASAGLESALAAFAENPTPGNGYRLLRAQDAGFFPAARYWVQATFVGFLRALRDAVLKALGLGPKTLSAADSSAAFERLDRAHYAAMQRLLRRGARAPRGAELEALRAEAASLAEAYGRLTGDPEASRAVARARDAESLRYWIDRIHEKALALRPAAAPADAADRSWAPGALATLLAQVKANPASASAFASALQSLDSGDSPFLTLGRVRIAGRELLAQGQRRALPDGRALTLTGLRDARTGLFAFGRAEAARGAAKPSPVAPQALKTLLAH